MKRSLVNSFLLLVVSFSDSYIKFHIIFSPFLKCYSFALNLKILENKRNVLLENE